MGLSGGISNTIPADATLKYQISLDGTVRVEDRSRPAAKYAAYNQGSTGTGKDTLVAAEG